MRLFVTGAAGFLGSAVVTTAIDAGHDVTALVRSGGDRLPAEVTQVRGDIRDPEGWADAVAGCDTVVHLAASLTGDEAELVSIATEGTRHLVDAMVAGGVERLVLVSSLAVYDLAFVATGGIVDEHTPLAGDATDRDPYARAKLAQEKEAARAPWVTVVRPGLVWDRDHHWNGGQTLSLTSRLGITIAPDGALPLTHVDNCAAAIVAAAVLDGPPAIVNVIDDPTPTRAEFAAALRAAGVDLPPQIRLPWALVDGGVRAVAGVASVLRIADKLPGLLRPAQLAARCRPFRYPNDGARSRLGWAPAVTLEAALDTAC